MGGITKDKLMYLIGQLHLLDLIWKIRQKFSHNL
jgi:hypothetical protein